MNTPSCRKCGAELIVGENWYISQAKRNQRICIKCVKAYSQQQGRKYYQEHREEILARKRGQQHLYRQEHREEKAAYMRRYHQGHCQERNAYSQRYGQEHREERAAYRRKHRRTNIQARIAESLRAGLRMAVKNGQKAGSAICNLGCSIPEFMAYFATLFQESMSWDNYGEWQIDHIVPLSSFDLTDRKQVKQVCHYTNLQPLWAADNSRKGARNYGR